MKSELAQLRAYWTKHRAVGRPTPDVGWEELDVLLAALDALEAEAKDAELTTIKIAAKLQARIDAATKLIQEAMSHIHMTEPLTDCELCTPYREWLAGAEGEKSDDHE